MLVEVEKFGKLGLHLQEPAQSELPQRVQQTGHSRRRWAGDSAGALRGEAKGASAFGSVVMYVCPCSLSKRRTEFSRAHCQSGFSLDLFGCVAWLLNRPVCICTL